MQEVQGEDMRMTRKSSCRILRSDSAGFSLLELMTVMLVMFVMMGISTAALRGIMRGAGVRGAISSMRGVLTQARQNAVMNQQPVAVRISESGETISMEVLVGFGRVGRFLGNQNNIEVVSPLPWTGDEIKGSAVYNFRGGSGTITAGYVGTNIDGNIMTNLMGYVTSGISWSAADGGDHVAFVVGNARRLPDGIEIDDFENPSIVQFAPDGSASGALSFTLRERNKSGGDSFIVEVDANTGRIKVN
jgi:hypothetical protein